MLQVHPIPAFSDNYIWAIRCPAKPNCVVVVDPGDAVPVERYLMDTGQELAAILLTHKHADHIGGVAALRAAHTEVLLVGPEHPAMPSPDLAAADGGVIDVVGTGLEFEVMAVPGHTLEHVAYVGHRSLFCGDTLFSYGCGRLFEGSAAQMLASLDRIAALAPETAIYCTHEYTEANLRFARQVLPDDEELRAAEERVASMRRAGRPSLPVRLVDELRGNLFLRVDEPALRAACEREVGGPLADRTVVFAALRGWKDRS
jgi:hydroxyacylglutathione hydrolase